MKPDWSFNLVLQPSQYHSSSDPPRDDRNPPTIFPNKPMVQTTFSTVFVGYNLKLLASDRKLDRYAH